MLKGFPPLPSFAWSYTYHKGYLKDDKNEVLYRQMVLLQRSERLDPKSSLAWLHSGRCVVWHAALRLLYLGQGAYFFVLVHGKMIDTDETWNSAEHFPGFSSNTSQWRGWGPWQLGNAHSLTQNEFPQWFWGFCC